MQKKTSGRVDQLVEKFKDYQNRLEIVKAKRKALYQRLLAVEQEILEKGSNELVGKRDGLKDEYLSLTIREEAIGSLLEQIKEEIAAEIPEELKQNLAEIEAELQGLREKENEKRLELARVMAVLGVLWEELRGATVVQRPSGELKTVYPRIEVNGLSPVHGEIQGKYFQEVDKLRKKHKITIRSRLDQLMKERIRIRGLLERDSGELADKLLGLSNEPGSDKKNKKPKQKWWFTTGKHPDREGLRPEYGDSPLPKTDFRPAKMYPDR